MKELDIICLGELLIDLIGDADGGEAVSGFKIYPGGAAGNVAVAASKLGLRAGIIAKTSADYFGDYLHDIMAQSGVDTEGIVRDREHRATLAFVTMDEQKKPSYMFYREAAASTFLCADELNPGYFRSSKVLYFSSMGLIKQPIRDANYEAVRLAKQNGMQIAFDPNIRIRLWPDEAAARSEILKMMQHADVLKMNDEELQFLFGPANIKESCGGIMEQFPGLKLLAITQGENGVSLMNRTGDYCHVDVLDTDIVDTIGSGDAFFATLLWQYIGTGYDISDAEKLRRIGQYANAAALLTAKKPGAISALPGLKEVEQMVRGYNSGNE